MPDLDHTSPSAPPGTVFFGDDGLRAGWRIALYLLLVLATVTTSGFIVRHLPGPMPVRGAELQPRAALLNESLQFTWFAIPALVMSRIERRPFAQYGLRRRRLLPDFLSGVAWGFIVLSALIATLLLTHAIAFDGRLLHGTAALLSGLEWAFICFLVGLGEEFLFRGYLQYTLARAFEGILRNRRPAGPRIHLIAFLGAAIPLSGFLFMAAHLSNGGENAVGIAAVGLAGAVFAFSLYRTGSLWWAIGVHTAWDWAQSFFYGTPDSGTLSAGRLLASHPTGRTLLSGGADGPEGSLLVLPALLLLALILHRNFPRAPSSSQPHRD